jgi:hypothetical protein
VNPKVLSSVEDPNFAFWHSATISDDGKRVLSRTSSAAAVSRPATRRSARTAAPTRSIQRGFDTYKLDDPAVAGSSGFRTGTLNAPTQTRFGR